MKTQLLIPKMLILFLFIFVNASAQNENGKTLIVIDQLVENYDELSDQYASSESLLILPIDQNPVEAITEKLEEIKDIELLQIHVLVKPGSLIFDQLSLNIENMDNYRNALELWKSAFVEEGKIEIVPGNGSKAELSDEFKQELHRLTHLNVQ